MKLMKSIYGMKQAGHIWNQMFHKVVESLSFKRLPCEWCVYTRHSSTGTIIFAVHINDILCAVSSIEENAHFKAELKAHWEISDLGPASFALGRVCHRSHHGCHAMTLYPYPSTLYLSIYLYLQVQV